MIAALIAVVAVVWVLVGVLAAVALGVAIADADRRESPGPKSCCPHPPTEAPETVRGEFRAIIPGSSDRRGAHLDVKT